MSRETKPELSPARRKPSFRPRSRQKVRLQFSHAIDKKEPETSAKVPARFFLETLVCLAIAVNLFRTFVLEGFMISTGSMAPLLRGYHYALTCPDCGYEFAYSATETLPPALFGASEENANEAGSEPVISCPNCRYTHIQLAGLPINEGDQILVDKQAFVWQPPQRWSTLVFRNPNRPTQAYSKRIVGLPGDVIQIKEGDIYNGTEIQRKSLQVQRQMRTLVADSRYEPQLHDPDWQPRWVPVKREQSGWSTSENSFYQFEPGTDSQVDWLQFRNWFRSGGGIKTSLPLQKWPVDLPLPAEDSPLSFDPVQKVVACRGALPGEEKARLLSLTRDAAFRETLQKLYEQSHIIPITDRQSYSPIEAFRARTVRDLMVVADLVPGSLQSQFHMRVHEGSFEFSLRVDLAARTIELLTHREQKVLRKAAMAPLEFEQPVRIEMSVCDRQVLVAVNDQLALEPYAYRVPDPHQFPSGTPVHVGASNGPLEVTRLRVYRDLYYRRVGEPGRTYAVGPGELFVLGDNSAVSIDSRHWPPGTVQENLLVGRPFILHLPSRKKTIQLGPLATRIRVPQVERIQLLE